MDRDAIPAAIKRQVRKECGFGCAICGLPIYEYDHIDMYSKVKEHKIENIVLLCSNHHSEKSKGLLSSDIVRSHRMSPYNLELNKARGYFFRFNPNLPEFLLMIGNNSYIISNKALDRNFIAIELHGKPIFSIEREENVILFTLELTNRRGETIFKIEKNELIISIGDWDYEQIGTKFTIKSRINNIDIKISKLNNGISIDRGCFFLVKKNYLLIDPYEIICGIEIIEQDLFLLPSKSIFSGNKFYNCYVGISL